MTQGPHGREEAVVHVIDADPASRGQLVATLASVQLAVREYESGHGFLERFDPGSLGCVVFDLRLPGIGGFDLLDRIEDRAPGIPTIVVTAFGDVATAVNAMKRGVVDFIEKPAPAQRFIDEVHRAINMHRSRRRRQELRATVRSQLSGLTPREREVLDLLLRGQANKQIASNLGLSEKTVATHRAHILVKMDAPSIVTVAQRVAPLLDEEPSYEPSHAARQPLGAGA